MRVQPQRQAPNNGLKHVAVIGAGAAGVAAAKCLLEAGLEPTVFEQSAEIGGVWKYKEALPAGGGVAYRSLRTNTSKRMMAFSDFPYPREAPEFPGHDEVVQYLNAYADHFGLRKYINFNSAVVKAEPGEGGQWAIQSKDAAGTLTAQTFDAVIVASGLYRQPIIPPIKGQETFAGRAFHSAEYKGPEGLEGKRVVIVGVGPSGADIAAEVSEVAEHVELCTRTGVWFLPHYIGGKPYDTHVTRASEAIPYRIRMFVFRRLALAAYRQMGFTDRQIDRTLMLPVFDLWRTRLTPSTHVLKRILSGAISVRPGITRIETQGVGFADGSFAPADVILYCTGYALNFPFIQPSIVNPEGDVVELYKHVFHPRLPNLAFLSLCIVNGSVFPVAEMQARWAAQVWCGKAELPPPDARVQAIAQRRMLYRRLGSHPMRVQIAEYMDDLALQIGVRPKLLRHPRLFPSLVFGPLVAAQYRLDGAGKSDRAGAIIHAG